MNWNLVGRILVFGICVAVNGYIVFKDTPELDNVKNRGLYRWSYFMMVLRGMTWFFLDILNMFPPKS